MNDQNFLNFVIPPIVLSLIDATRESCEDLKKRIKNVKFSGFNEKMTEELIEFQFDDIVYEGALRSENRNFCIGFGEKSDKSIALKVLLARDCWAKFRVKV